MVTGRLKRKLRLVLACWIGKTVHTAIKFFFNKVLSFSYRIEDCNHCINNDIIPLHKVCRFCVLKKSTYRKELEDLLTSDQFQKSDEGKYKILMKTEKTDNQPPATTDEAGENC